LWFNQAFEMSLAIVLFRFANQAFSKSNELVDQYLQSAAWFNLFA
jgi:hypothetical protein